MIRCWKHRRCLFVGFPTTTGLFHVSAGRFVRVEAIHFSHKSLHLESQCVEVGICPMLENGCSRYKTRIFFRHVPWLGEVPVPQGDFGERILCQKGSPNHQNYPSSAPIDARPLTSLLGSKPPTTQSNAGSLPADLGNPLTTLTLHRKEYEREIQKLRRVYQERQMPFLEERDKANTLEQPPGPPEGNWNTQTKAGC